MLVADRCHRFGDFELREQPLSLARAGEPVALPVQPLRLLLQLVSKAGEIVTHDEIRELLWPGQAVDVTGRMHACVRQARRALEAGGDAGPFIETIPRTGYRFVAEVRCAPLAPVSDPAPEPSSGRGRLFLALALLTSLALVLGGRLIPGTGVAEEAPASSAVDAPESAFRRARVLLEGGRERERLEEAVMLLERARELDPTFAPIEAGLSRAWRGLGDAEAARRHALRAVELDPGYARGHLRLAEIRGWIDWNWDAALASLERALALTPEAVDVRIALARVLFFRGERAAAFALLEELVGEETASIEARVALGALYHLARRPDAAQRLCAEALEVSPEIPDARRCAFRVAVVRGDWPAALAALEGRNPSPGFTEASGDAEAAVRAIAARELEGLGAPEGAPVDAAYRAILLRRYDEAFQLLRLAARERAPGLAEALLDPIFVALHHQEAFVTLREEARIVVPEV